METKLDDQLKINEEEEEYFKPNWNESIENFEDFGLREEILRGVQGFGFYKPSPIQKKAILPII